MCPDIHGPDVIIISNEVNIGTCGGVRLKCDTYAQQTLIGDVHGEMVVWNVVWMYSCLWKRANRQSVYGDTCVDVSTARRCARTVKCDIVTTTNLHDHPRSLTSQQTVAALGLMTFYLTRCTAANWHPVASFPQVEGTPQGIQLRVWPCGANSCACLVAGGDHISFSTVATASPALASVCGIAVVTT